MAQWLRLPLPVYGVWVRSLFGKLRSHTPCGQKTKTILFLKLNFILQKVGKKDVKTLIMVILGWPNLESTFFFPLLSCVSQIFYNTNVIVDFMCPNI